MNEEKSIKDEVISFLDTLPDDITLDKTIYQLHVKYKILKRLDDIKHGRTHSHEEVKASMEKRFRLKEEQMSIEQMLNECCKMRGNPTLLIHRTIHEFNCFYQNLIFDKSKLLKNEFFEVTDNNLIDTITNRIPPQDDDLTLRSVVRLFYLYCKNIYDPNEPLKDIQMF